MRSWKDVAPLEKKLGKRVWIKPTLIPSFAGKQGVIWGITNSGVDLKTGYALLVRLDNGSLIGLPPKDVYLSKG